MWPFSPSYPELKPSDVGTPDLDDIDSFTYDYIVVGGGTAGCCLAARLSKDMSTTVLLIERGPVADTWANTVPMISGNVYEQDTLARQSKAEPLVQANDREVTLLSAEVLGGGSRVNAMLYTRGVAGDYNHWRDLGHAGWSYQNILPYFIRSEKSLSQFKSPFRGDSGPWENQTFPSPPWQCLSHARNAAASLGIPSVDDFNIPSIPSVSCSTLDVVIDRNMRRSSTFHSFLPSAVANSRKGHLKICANTLVAQILFDRLEDGTPRATGVKFASSDVKAAGSYHFAQARKEIILCSGALGTPQLLLLSGVGPAGHLRSQGITVVIDSPGVGSNLVRSITLLLLLMPFQKDHISVPLIWDNPLEDSMHILIQKPWMAVVEIFKYLIAGRGLMSQPFVHLAMFLPSRLLNDKGELLKLTPRDLDASLPENVPDIEITPMPIRGTPDYSPPAGAFTLMVCLLRPQSVGSVRLRSADPYARPKVELGFFTHPEDIVKIRKGVRLAMRIAEQMRTESYPLEPSPMLPASDSDADIDAFVRETCRTTYHYSSSCRMGAIDDVKPGVVDDELRVHGVEGLRIADLSVCPEILGAHTMALAVAIAEKCADLILTGKA
ncbi:alcohol oxidase [Lyophyllum atratum]|nr:alcohol oxidase [Lyophyllum atratum]